ncbi:MAG: 2-phospho-L-lactate transferase, partial [Dehalococcoidia bacterium]|nr:2-phospho-L-lactate transferase [Dehalococcoidia bacterium]
DRDLATAVHRTRLLREGRRMHEIVAELTAAFGVASTILPVTNERVATHVLTSDGELDFQDYMVRLATEPDVTGVRFAGADEAAPAPGVLDAIREADRLIIAPSNPFVSIGPILAVPGVREAVVESNARRIGISPIVGGQAIKGPAAKMLASLGHEVSAVGVAEIYRDLVDVMVIDEEDRALAPRIEALGLTCAVTNTMMTSPERKAALARFLTTL